MTSSTIQQYLREGLIDELHIAIARVLLGSGERLFEGVDLRALGFECIESAASEQAVMSGIQMQMTTIELGAAYWQQLLTWSNKQFLLAPDEQSIVAVACNIPKKLPTEKQVVSKPSALFSSFSLPLFFLLMYNCLCIGSRL